MNRLRSERLAARIAVAVLLLCSATALAKELDQFSDRRMQLAYYASGFQTARGSPGPAQIDRIVDGEMNRLLRELEDELNDAEPEGAQARLQCAKKVFQHPILAELVTPYEEWLRLEAPVPLYEVLGRGIWGHRIDYDDMRLSWYIEPSPVVHIAGVLMGVDKPGHFLAQGYQYYTRYLELPESWSEAQKLAALRRYGHEMEQGNLGVATTGVYSYADLAANWQGFLFHRALFETVEQDGAHHAAYFRVDDRGQYRLARQFTWAEWATADWDEALNPALVTTQRLYDKLHENFWRRSGREGASRPSICEEFLRDPPAFLGPHGVLWPRSTYALVGSEPAMGRFALDITRLCAARPGTRRP